MLRRDYATRPGSGTRVRSPSRRSAKADGWFGGNPRNGWIVTRDAQAVVVPIVKDLVAVRALLASVPG